MSLYVEVWSCERDPTRSCGGESFWRALASCCSTALLEWNAWRTLEYHNELVFDIRIRGTVSYLLVSEV